MLIGGTCGCLIAGRIAASHPFLKILILEAGPSTRDELKHIQPGRYIHNLATSSNVMKYYVGEPSEALAGKYGARSDPSGHHTHAPTFPGRAPLVPTGHCLGGGSSVNRE